MDEATPVAMEVWRKAMSAFAQHSDQAAAAVIATELADMQRRVEALEGALAKAGFMMTEPHNVGDHRGRKLVIGFQNADDADLAMEALAKAITARRAQP